MASIAALAFVLWYPPMYRGVTGSVRLFWLIALVDVTLGPLLTFVVFNPAKPRRELARDLAVVVAIQLGALAYGLFTLVQARPVLMVFEVDRFRVVSATDIDPAELHKAPVGLRQLPLAGVRLIGARRARDSHELTESLAATGAGTDISMQPKFWVEFDLQRNEALAKSLPWSQVVAERPQNRSALDAGAAEAERRFGVPRDRLRLLPVQSRFADWSALTDDRAEPLLLVPVDLLQ